MWAFPAACSGKGCCCKCPSEHKQQCSSDGRTYVPSKPRKDPIVSRWALAGSHSKKRQVCSSRICRACSRAGEKDRRRRARNCTDCTKAASRTAPPRAPAESCVKPAVAGCGPRWPERPESLANDVFTLPSRATRACLTICTLCALSLPLYLYLLLPSRRMRQGLAVDENERRPPSAG